MRLPECEWLLFSCAQGSQGRHLSVVFVVRTGSIVCVWTSGLPQSATGVNADWGQLTIPLHRVAGGEQSQPFILSCWDYREVSTSVA